MTELAVRRGLVWRWRFVLRTCNPPPGPLDPVTRWLVLTRACAQPMTLTAGAVAGLLAVRHPGFDAALWLAAAAGLVAAHAANNLMNDYFDLEAGTDTADYPRALYAPHPVLGGLISRRGLRAAMLAVNLADLGLLGYLFTRRGWPVVAFALAGFAISAGYTAPPLRLKARGLGEPGVLAVWGPLMVGGTYYAATGTLPWQVVAASVPYGLLATAVLFGKHIDKLPWDARRGLRTLPVRLGEAAARQVNRALMAGFYASVAALVAVRALPPTTLVVFLAFPRLRVAWRAHGRPKPAEPPRGFAVWPLWFAAASFWHTRRAGALFVTGLAAGALLKL